MGAKIACGPGMGNYYITSDGLIHVWHLKGTKEQQEEIGKMGEGLKSTQSLIKTKQIQRICGALCFLEDRKPCLPT